MSYSRDERIYFMDLHFPGSYICSLVQTVNSSSEKILILKQVLFPGMWRSNLQIFTFRGSAFLIKKELRRSNCEYFLANKYLFGNKAYSRGVKIYFTDRYIPGVCICFNCWELRWSNHANIQQTVFFTVKNSLLKRSWIYYPS